MASYTVNQLYAMINTEQSTAALLARFQPQNKAVLAQSYWQQAIIYNEIFLRLPAKSEKTVDTLKRKVHSLVELARDTYPDTHADDIQQCNDFLQTIAPFGLAAEVDLSTQASSTQQPNSSQETSRDLCFLHTKKSAKPYLPSTNQDKAIPTPDSPQSGVKPS